MTKIEWTQTIDKKGNKTKGKSWNPITGCTQISKGCRSCYAKVMHKRLKGMGKKKYQFDFKKVIFHESELTIPATWKKPRKIFVCSMSDLFHEKVEDRQIRAILGIIEVNPQHTFQLLTKRAERLPNFVYPSNVWLGVTIEHNDYVKRADYLRKTNAKVKFISAEPLLGYLIDIILTDINWVIVGGESGPKTKVRRMHYPWVRHLKDKIDRYDNIRFFYKQGGSHNQCHSFVKEYHKDDPGCNSKGCKILDGRVWEELP
ncbi:MAG: phage Gp37/Gp68 family protein [Cocleimonas sp.]